MDTNLIRQELLENEEVRQQIAMRAFQIFQECGYVMGRDLEHWLMAENQILPMLMEQEIKHREKSKMTDVTLEPNSLRMIEEPIAAIPTIKSDSTKKVSKKTSGAFEKPKSAAKSAGKNKTT